jgi:hypothetical protein
MIELTIQKRLVSACRKFLYLMTLVCAHIFTDSRITLEVIVKSKAMLEKTVLWALVNHLYFALCCLNVAIRYGKAWNGDKYSGSKCDRSQETFSRIETGKSHVELVLHGTKSSPESLSRACNRMWRMQIKHALLFALSRPEQNKCFASHSVSFLTVGISNRNFPENLNPALLACEAAFKVAKHVE